MKSLILLVLFTGVIAIPPKSYKAEFERFEVQFNKVYENEVERLKRFEVFKENLREYESFNNEGHNWRKGINQFSDFTQDEFKQRLNGYLNIGKPFGKTSSSKTKVDLRSLPDSVDWRQRGAVSSVKDQGACGSCWAFSAVHSIESYLQLSTNGTRQVEELSAQQLTSCVPNPLKCGGNGGCSGSVPQLAFQYTQAFGLVKDSDYPYISGNWGDTETCDIGESYGPKPQDAIATLRGYESLPSNNYEAVMEHLATKGPLSVSVDASGWSAYWGGVYDFCDYNQNIELNHAVQLIGYGTDPQEGDYWLIRNSWSEFWGEDGYIRLRRESNPPCGTDSTPLMGGGCVGDGKDVLTVCGQCGVLFDLSYPIGVSYIEK